MKRWTGIGTVAALFLIDIKTKEYIEGHIDEKDKDRSVLGGKILLRKTYNEGIAMNGWEKHPQMVKRLSLAMSLAGTIAYFFLLRRKERRMEKAGMTLLLGGALGNTYERVTKGKVTDFLAIGAENKKIRDVTFNLADLFIILGTLFGLFGSVHKEKK